MQGRSRLYSLGPLLRVSAGLLCWGAVVLIFVYSRLSYMHAEMLVVPTFQRSTLDLVQMGEKIEAEKDQLLEAVNYTFCCCVSDAQKKSRFNFCCFDPEIAPLQHTVVQHSLPPDARTCLLAPVHGLCPGGLRHSTATGLLGRLH